MAFPCENPEGDHGKHFLMTTLSLQGDSHEAVEEGTEEMKPSLFSADASSSQHRGIAVKGMLSSRGCSTHESSPMPILHGAKGDRLGTYSAPSSSSLCNVLFSFVTSALKGRSLAFTEQFITSFIHRTKARNSSAETYCLFAI
jgi:hypothetical protein